MEKLKIMLIFGVLVLWPGRVVAAPEELFKQANAAYAAGDFAKATTLYESARKEGLHHWMLHFNLGNGYYKTNQLGRAVAEYWRAFRMNSGNRDVVYNLQLASTKAGDAALPASALPQLFWRLFFWPSANLLTLIAVVALLGLCALALGGLLEKFRVNADVIVAISVIFVLAGAWVAGRAWYVQKPEGIVVASVAEVRSGPNLSYPANFTVPEGHRVVLLDVQEPVSGWVEIGVPDQGLKGWLPESAVDVL